MPKDTVNTKSKQLFKWKTVNYLKKKTTVGYCKYILSIFSAGRPLLKKWKELEGSIIYIFCGFVVFFRCPHMTIVEHRSLPQNFTFIHCVWEDGERVQRNDAPCNKINSNYLNWCDASQNLVHNFLSVTWKKLPP